uniref:Uncharacterized protein n=1 Tax=Neospora caninum (strain Liverpool) TaxID=572307 RepID=A0A0F7UNL1_NEOCL|nr:TPA: hypothetical protein BN1204_057595 [Neospora caninum Liverpool]
MDRTSLLFTAAAALLPDRPQVLGLSPPQVVLVLQQLMRHLQRFSPQCEVLNGNSVQHRVQAALQEAAEISKPASTAGERERDSAAPTVAGISIRTLTDDVCRTISSSGGEKGYAHSETASAAKSEPETFKSWEPGTRWLSRVLLALLAQQVAREVINAALRRFAPPASKAKNGLDETRGFLQEVNHRAVCIMSKGAASSLPVLLSVHNTLCRAAGALQRMATHRVKAYSEADTGNDNHNDASEFGAEDKMTGPLRSQGTQHSSRISGAPGRIPRLLIGKTATTRPDLGTTSAAIETLLSLQRTKRELDPFKNEDMLEQTIAETSRTEEQHAAEETRNPSATAHNVTAAILTGIVALQQKLGFVCRLLFNSPYSRGLEKEMSQAELRQLLIGEGPTYGPVNTGRAKL